MLLTNPVHPVNPVYSLCPNLLWFDLVSLLTMSTRCESYFD